MPFKEEVSKQAEVSQPETKEEEAEPASSSCDPRSSAGDPGSAAVAKPYVLVQNLGFRVRASGAQG